MTRPLKDGPDVNAVNRAKRTKDEARTMRV
jgi:hypothetical protein